MNRNLKLCFVIIAMLMLLPASILTVPNATEKWGDFWQVRAYLVSYTGYITMMLMSLTVILSAKFRPLENLLKGLDKQYRLHKHMGISAVVFALIHWFVFLSDDLVMAMGMVSETEERYPFWKLLSLLGEPAQLIGEWGFYIAAILVTIALIKRFPYQTFEKTHQIFAYLYLLIVFHMIVFFQSSLWLTFPGLCLAIVVSIAVVACVRSILSLNGSKNRQAAEVEKVDFLDHGVAIGLKSIDRAGKEIMKKYRPGQFVYASFDGNEKPHPFSLALINPIRESLKS